MPASIGWSSGQLEALHDVVDPVAREEAHEVVLPGEVEARLAGVALAARAAAELVVDPARLVPLGAEHVEAAEVDDAFAELDVDAAAGHVRRDRDGAALPGVLDDLGLAGVLLGVQHVVRDALPLQELAQVLGGLDGDRADEHRLALDGALLDVLGDGGELRLLGLEDQVVLVVAGDVDVGRDLDDVQAVDLDELLLLRLRGAGHAAELLVEAEVVLERDRREGLVLLLDRDALLRLDRLVQALAPAAPFHDPAGELVDDLHLAVLDDVVDVALVQRLGLQGLVEVVDELDVLRVVEVVDPQRALDLLDPRLGRRDGLVLLVVEVVELLGEPLVLELRPVRLGAAQRRDDPREVVVDLRGGRRLAGDDQRRPRLVDEDRVDLVHDRVGVAALDDAVERDRHVVAQVVEPELGVRAVRDVGVVGRAALVERHHRLDVGDGHAEPLEDAAVPLGVALGEVVVDGHEVGAAAGERVQVERHARDEGLAFTGLHLGDVALVQDDAAHHLDVEDALVGLAHARLARGREGLEEQILELLAALEPLAELDGLALQLGVGELLELRLERGDVGGLLLQPLHAPSLAEAKGLLERVDRRGHRGTGYRV